MSEDAHNPSVGSRKNPNPKPLKQIFDSMSVLKQPGISVAFNPEDGATYFDVRVRDNADYNGESNPRALTNFIQNHLRQDEVVRLAAYELRKDAPPYSVIPAAPTGEAWDNRVTPTPIELFDGVLRAAENYATDMGLAFLPHTPPPRPKPDKPAGSPPEQAEIPGYS
jgi:hypothetical protein